MLYIVRVFEEGETYEYEYGNLIHALEHYDSEDEAVILEYRNGKEKILVSRDLEEELEV